MKNLRGFYVKFSFIQKNQDRFSSEFILKVKKIFFSHYLSMINESDFEGWEKFGREKPEDGFSENLSHGVGSVYLEEESKNCKYLNYCESDLSQLRDFFPNLKQEKLFLDSLTFQSIMEMVEGLGLSLACQNKEFYFREINKLFSQTSLNFFSKWTSNQSSVLNFYSDSSGSIFLELKRQIQDWIYCEKNMNLSFDEINDQVLFFFKKACSLSGYTFLSEMPVWVRRDFNEYLQFLKEIGLDKIDVDKIMLSFSQVKTDTSLRGVQNQVDYSKFKDYDQHRIISLFLNIYSYYSNSGVGKSQSLEFSFPVYSGSARWLDILNEVYFSVLRCVSEEENIDLLKLSRIFSRGISKIRSSMGGENSRLANSLAVLSDICCANQSYFCQLYRPSISIFPFLLNDPSSNPNISSNIEAHLISITRGSILKYLSTVSHRVVKSTDPIKVKSAEFLNFALYELEWMPSSEERLKFFCDRYQFEMNTEILNANPLNRTIYFLNQIFKSMQEEFPFISDIDIYSQGEFGVMKKEIFDQLREFSRVECAM